MTSSIGEDIANAIVTTIQGLNLATITSQEIIIQKKPYTEDECHRGVFLCPEQPGRNFAYGVVGANEVKYPNGFYIIRGRQGNFTESPFQIMEDLAKVGDAFHQKRLSGVLSVTICMVAPKAVILPDKFKKDYDASALVINCWSREFGPRS